MEVSGSTDLQLFSQEPFHIYMYIEQIGAHKAMLTIYVDGENGDVSEYIQAGGQDIAALLAFDKGDDPWSTGDRD